MAINFHKHNPNRELDFYPTPAPFTEVLTRNVNIKGKIYEPCCGNGAMSEVLQSVGDVESSDIRHYGYGPTIIRDVFDLWDVEGSSIVTNPPYINALEIIRHLLDLRAAMVAMLLRQTFLEGMERFIFFQKHPPSKVIIISTRMPNSQFGHCWIVWDGDGTGKTELSWDIART